MFLSLLQSSNATDVAAALPSTTASLTWGYSLHYVLAHAPSAGSLNATA
ncbi:MAG: hypothetical protein JXR40_09670 [Pontiellaceae bacterium]|nr:hypothetical protein [Pontiellaceae bacterium]